MFSSPQSWQEAGISATAELTKAPQSADHRAARYRAVAAVLFVLAVATAVLLAKDFLTLDRLRNEQFRLLAFVDQRYVLAVAIFVLVYVIACACAVPGIVLLTIAGGLVFKPVPATAYIAFGATLGAIILYVVTRFVATDWVMARAGPWAQRTEEGFRRNAWTYMFLLRLIPLFPFVMVNFVAALLRVPFKVFVVGTFFGVLPGTFVYATLGAGIGDVLAMGSEIDFAGALLQPSVIGALAGLAALAVIPLVYRKFAARP